MRSCWRLGRTRFSSGSPPTGVGKSFLAQALGYAAIRAGHTVRFIHADDFFRAMVQAPVDNSVDRVFRSFLSPDLLIMDDLGLHRLTGQQSADLYELIVSRHRVSSFVITSNRAASPTPATRLSLRVPATGKGCLHTVNSWVRGRCLTLQRQPDTSPNHPRQGGLMSVKIPGLITLINDSLPDQFHVTGP